MITDKHLPALQGMFPSWITSCSESGEPNTTVISQIWYVDESQVDDAGEGQWVDCRPGNEGSPS